jgi:hypothetical protein
MVDDVLSRCAARDVAARLPQAVDLNGRWCSTAEAWRNEIVTRRPIEGPYHGAAG